MRLKGSASAQPVEPEAVKPVEVAAPAVKPVEVAAPAVKPVEVAAPAVKPVEVAAPAVKTATPKKSISIVCSKGKITKKITGTRPKCPSGYKKK